MARPALACLAVLLLCTAALASKDYYDLLHVSRGASTAVIKRAYRKLALQYHPDKVQGSDQEKEDAAKTFAEISHAYEVLTDDQKRQVYDQYGEEGLKQMGGGGGGHGGHDIFSQFFGHFGFGGMGQQEEPETPKGETVMMELAVTLEDLYLGKTYTFTRDKGVLKPAPGKRKCNCSQRVVTRQVGPGMYQQYTTQSCEECPNVKLEREAEEVTVHVEPGMPNWHDISFFEQGEPLVDGDPGDLVVRLVTEPHPVFERRRDWLLTNVTITLLEALTGFEKELTHLDGHVVEVGSKDITRPGQSRVFKGEGMPVHEKGGFGDLWVTYKVAFPTKLSAADEAVLKKVLGSATWHDEL